jgi:hypothetical protein
VVVDKHRHRPRRAEGLGDPRMRREQAEDAAAPHDVAAEQDGDEQHGRIQHRAATDDERDEAEIVAELPQHRTETPQAGVAPPARVAPVVVDADERSTRRADDGPGPLSLEHLSEAYNNGPHNLAD